ncbi:ATP-binding cassette domain-containing protein [Gordonia soli]|uniref:Putative ABC transporter ATP-binding protein n=1 Tax=Gordonia soli NBRC 108243 TaxID=1223545 RepID=M0QMH4_9ACTN|nr:ATP-binding cassette domain-containing protein [Gordonia soli]GAC69773.1 putative ABC transporter ATP-binding protein [Gordonia soli NBRC 108243]
MPEPISPTEGSEGVSSRRQEESVTPAIETAGLTKIFGGRRVVDSVDLSVPAGSVYAVLGTNGAGKTTTVRMLATLLRPDAGTARVFGRDVVSHPTAVRSVIGLTGQYASVDDDLTARENLALFGRLVGAGRRRARSTADDLLAEFGLADASDRRVREFSGGMRRRLDLAASMITRPPLLFLDEPTTGLDPRTRTQMWQKVEELVAAGSTVLLTTQYLDEADRLAARVAVMDAGRVVAEGTPDQLKSEVGEASVHLDVVDQDAIVRAAQVCAHFATGEVSVAHGRTVVVPMPDLTALPELLAAVRGADIAYSSVAVNRPTLDDVFFALTGPDARAAEVADPESATPDAAVAGVAGRPTRSRSAA